MNPWFWMRNKSAAIHRSTLAVVLATLSGISPVLAQSSAPSQSNAQAPISAIDWLDNSQNLAALPTRPPLRPGTSSVWDETPVAETILIPEVTTRPLNAPKAGAVGLLPRSVTGLPATLWQGSLAPALIRKVNRLDVDAIPAMQSLLYTLLLTEADPPMQDAAGMAFLLARIDKLIEIGAVDPALALTERAGPTTHPDLFSRWFDLTLLTGDEHRACKTMRERPSLAPSGSALTFCRAAQGQYDLATLTFGNAAALGLLTPGEESLLRLYLDPDLAEETPQLPPPAKVTPLTFRLSEAIGQPLRTQGLPRAYAMTDLRGVSGWRAEIEAAERLTQSGALAENRLLGIYTSRRPSASGEPWDRVEAVQALDTLLEDAQTAKSGQLDDPSLATQLPITWDALRKVALEVPFARLWGETLAGLNLTGTAATTVFEIAMLSPQYESLAAKLPHPDARTKFLAALAGGQPEKASAPDELTRAVQRGFDPETEIPASIRLDLTQGKLGEAILSAMTLITQAAEGATKDIAPALATLRSVGLEDTARRTAIQLILLDRQT